MKVTWDQMKTFLHERPHLSPQVSVDDSAYIVEIFDGGSYKKVILRTQVTFIFSSIKNYRCVD